MKKLAILAATGNAHKMREFREIFREVLTCHAEWEIDIFAERELAERIGLLYEAPEETGTRFCENSAIKANGIRAFLQAHPEALPEGYDRTVIIADDSGICVDALGGAPGVLSARYAQKQGVSGNADDGDNLEKLLADMHGVPREKRQAAFVCSITAIVLSEKADAVREIQTEGRIKGLLTEEPFGAGGFGYDPIFYVERFGKTTAEMTPEEKNAISHRGMALREAAEKVYGIFTEL